MRHDDSTRYQMHLEQVGGARLARALRLLDFCEPRVCRWIVALSTTLMLGACTTAHPVALAPVPRADTATKRFYANRDYGSEAEFNPFSLIVNGGYDQIRTGENRKIFDLPYRDAMRTVFESVTNPVPRIKRYGVKEWLTHEVFPLSLKRSGGGQWYPNYHLHLFAGGATYARTVEWYEQHGTTHPKLAAGLTVFGWHLLTELVESNGICCDDVDGLTDLLVFDTGSILLWNQSWVRRPFGRRIEFTNWMGQPSLDPSSGRLENAYMMAMLRVPLPRTDDWKLLNTMGNAFLFGVSRRVGKNLWITPSAGFDPVDNPVINQATGARTATLKPNAGVFVDRDGSLLVSFITKGGSTNGATLNVYPGVVGSGWWSPGLWVQAVHGGGYRYGIVSRLGIGLGQMRR